MKFRIEFRDAGSHARAGIIETAHGRIETPVFMPVGTAGTVKAVSQQQLETEVKAQVILGNTYHLSLRPGTGLIEKAGGLHRFMNWSRPILTDSGGYQVFSLSENRKVSEEGVSFQSHIDGSKLFISPESAINMQRSIGADIIMAFDECIAHPCEYNDAKQSMLLTHRWLKRCAARFDETNVDLQSDQTLFPIVQGGTYKDLRMQSAEFVSELEMEGNAIGGLSVGEPSEIMYEMTSHVCSALPDEKPRYLMGVGTPANLLECIALGVDMFDCVMPTRNGRNGMLFTRNGIINIRNEKWKEDFSCIDPEGASVADGFYSKAYLRHLTVSNEILALQICSIHNLVFYQTLMKESRERIKDGTFVQWKNKLVPALENRL